jgi:hypothetical protein
LKGGGGWGVVFLFFSNTKIETKDKGGFFFPYNKYMGKTTTANNNNKK